MLPAPFLPAKRAWQISGRALVAPKSMLLDWRRCMTRTRKQYGCQAKSGNRPVNGPPGRCPRQSRGRVCGPATKAVRGRVLARRYPSVPMQKGGCRGAAAQKGKMISTPLVARKRSRQRACLVGEKKQVCIRNPFPKKEKGERRSAPPSLSNYLWGNFSKAPLVFGATKGRLSPAGPFTSPRCTSWPLFSPCRKSRTG